MRAMNLTRVASAAGLAATFALCACGTEETIVAVNVDFDGVGAASSLTLEISQSGDTVTRQLTELATTTTDETTTLNSFYERVAVPDSWSESPATVTGTLIDATGAPVYVDQTEVTIRPEGAVVAFLQFPPEMEEPEEPDPNAGGTGGTGGDGGGTAGDTAGGGTAGDMTARGTAGMAGSTGGGGEGGGEGGTSGGDASEGGAGGTPAAG